MSQVRKLQTGGTAPKPESNKYTVRVNGNNFDVGHEEIQSWFNDYMKAGGGKTKNRDDWNNNFNELLGSVKQSNSKGEAFDFDLQGDTIGSINYSGSPDDYTKDQLGLRSDGKSAKAGFGAGITGVKNPTAIRASLLSGLADYSGKAYTNTLALNEKEAKDNEAKAKAEADKLKLEGSKAFNDRLNAYSSHLDPTSGFKSLDGKNASMEYAVSSYNKMDAAGRKSFLQGLGTKARDEFNSLYTEAQQNPEYLKSFEGKFGKDAATRLGKFSDAADWIRNANPETIGTFTDPKTFEKLSATTAAPLVYKQNPDGTFSNGDGKTYLDDKGTVANGNDPAGNRWINGMLANGTFDNLLYRQGKPFEGIEGNLRYRQGALFSGPDIKEGDLDPNAPRFDRTNYRDIPLFLEGKRTSFDDFYKATATGDKYKNLAQVTKQILDIGRFKDKELDTQWTTTNRDLDRNAYDPFENVPSNQLPERYKNLSGSFENFDPSKGAITEEFSGKYDSNGIPITMLFYRNGRNRVRSNITVDNVGNYTLTTNKGEKIYLGANRGGNPKDISKSKYNFNKTRPDTYVPSGRGPSTLGLKEGGKLEALAVKKHQYGGIVGSGGGKQEQYKEVGFKDAFSDPNYQMTTTDKFQLGALLADIGSLGLTIAGPGVGNVAAAGVGLAGTAANFGANWAKDGLDWGDVGEAGIGAGLDVLTLLPGLGTGAKSAKILRSLKYAAPMIGTVLMGAGLKQSYDSFKKVLAGDATMDDWRHLATGLTGAISGKRMAFDKMLGTSKGAITHSIKDAKGASYPLNSTMISAFEDAKSQKDKVALAKNYIASQLTKQGGEGAAAFKAEDVQLPTGFGLKGWKPTLGKEKLSIDATSSGRTLDELTEGGGVGGWLKNRAIRRVAMGNPTMTGASEVLGDANKLKSTPWGRQFAMSPWGNKIGRNAPVLSSDVNARTFSLSGDQTPQFGLRMPNSQLGQVDQNLENFSGQLKDVINKANTNIKNGIPTAGTPDVASGSTALTRATPMEVATTGKGANKSTAATPRGLVRQNQLIRTDEQGPLVRNDEYTVSGDNISGFRPRPRPKQEQVKRILSGQKELPIGKEVKQLESGQPKQLETIPERKLLSGPKKGDANRPSADQLTKVRRQLGLSTNKEHEITLEKIFSPKKGTVEEKLSKRILKDKRLKQYVDDAVKEGRTSIKLAEGGVVKALDGIKFPMAILPTTSSLRKWRSPFGLTGQFNPLAGLATADEITGNANIPIPTKTAPLTGLNIAFNNYKNKNLQSRGINKDGTPVTGKGNVISNFINGIDTNTVSELGRALYNRKLAKNVDTRMEVPLATNVTEVATPIKGDNILSSAYDRSASRIVSDMGRAKTSDAMLELAGRLSANKQAEDLRLQGAGANAEAIARSSQANQQAQAAYAAGRQQVANQNQQALAQKTQVERQMNNQKMLSMGKSMDNFWASQNQKNYMNDQYNKAYDSAIGGMQVDSKYSKDIGAALTNANTAQAAYDAAVRSNDPIAIEAAKKAMLASSEAGTRIGSNINYLKLQLQKNPKWAGLDGFDINADPFASTEPTQVSNRMKFYTRRPSSYASGGKMTAEDKIALEAYKETNKSFKETAKDYNKWLTLKTKEDKKELLVASKSIGDLIKQALNPK